MKYSPLTVGMPVRIFNSKSRRVPLYTAERPDYPTTSGSGEYEIGIIVEIEYSERTDDVWARAKVFKDGREFFTDSRCRAWFQPLSEAPEDSPMAWD